MAPEHLRSLAPDEVSSLKPLIREGLEQLQRASQASDYIDLSHDQLDQADLEQAASQPAGNDIEADPEVPIVELSPEPPVQATQEAQEEAAELKEAVEQFAPAETEAEDEKDKRKAEVLGESTSASEVE